MTPARTKKVTVEFTNGSRAQFANVVTIHRDTTVIILEWLDNSVTYLPLRNVNRIEAVYEQTEPVSSKDLPS